MNNTNAQVWQSGDAETDGALLDIESLITYMNQHFEEREYDARVIGGNEIETNERRLYALYKKCFAIRGRFTELQALKFIEVCLFIKLYLDRPSKLNSYYESFGKA